MWLDFFNFPDAEGTAPGVPCRTLAYSAALHKLDARRALQGAAQTPGPPDGLAETWEAVGTRPRKQMKTITLL